MLNYIKWKIIYILGLVISLSSYIFLFWCIYKTGIAAIEHSDNLKEYMSTADCKIHIMLLLVSVVYYYIAKHMATYIDTISRHQTEYDKATGLNKKYSSYDRLSRAERNEIDRQKIMWLEQIIDTNTLRKHTHKGSKNPEADINSLRGLEDVKKEIKLMAARMKTQKKKERNISSMHMCFVGPPGTGKTTCARIMAGFLYKYGFIKENKILEIDGNFLKGGADTALKVERIVQWASGGVLFIDEAYALMQGNFYEGQEAIATLVKLMEDKKNDFVLILAGYSEEMKMLVKSNTGLYSRIKHYLGFLPYDAELLSCIFEDYAIKHGYTLDEGVKPYVKNRIIECMNLPNFGNVRTVRNLFDKTLDLHALNLMEGNSEGKHILSKKDIPLKNWEDDFFSE